jgi:hypothetical protein
MRVLALTSLVFLLSTGAALADRRGGGKVIVRDHRGGGGGGAVVVREQRGPVVVRDNRRAVVVHDNRRVVVRRSPVYVSGGRYTFGGGVVREYRRPVIREHYYNIHVRPTLIVETYDPVPGYLWVGGNWRWNGAEWLWISGYWAVDPNY